MTFYVGATAIIHKFPSSSIFMMSFSCSKMWGLQARTSIAWDKSIATLFSLAIPLNKIHGSSRFYFLSISLFSNCSRHVGMSVGFEMAALSLIEL